MSSLGFLKDFQLNTDHKESRDKLFGLSKKNRAEQTPLHLPETEYNVAIFQYFFSIIYFITGLRSPIKTDELETEYFITIQNPKIHKVPVWDGGNFFNFGCALCTPVNQYFTSLTVDILAVLEASLDVLEASWVLNNTIICPLLLPNCFSSELCLTTVVLQSVFSQSF